MGKLIIRTEDIKDGELLDIFVESKKDREIIDRIKTDKQVLLIGSRGSGKTMLLKVAQKELSDNFKESKILPVYMSFSKSILVNTELDKNNFLYWMLSKIFSSFRSSLIKFGIITSTNNPFELLFSSNSTKNSLDEFIQMLETSWRDKEPLTKDDIVSILGVSKENIKIIDDVDFIKNIIQEFVKMYNLKGVFSYLMRHVIILYQNNKEYFFHCLGI